MKFFSGITYATILSFLNEYHNARYLLVDVVDDVGVIPSGGDTSRRGRSEGKLVVVLWRINPTVYSSIFSRI